MVFSSYERALQAERRCRRASPYRAETIRRSCIRASGALSHRDECDESNCACSFRAVLRQGETKIPSWC